MCIIVSLFYAGQSRWGGVHKEVALPMPAEAEPKMPPAPSRAAAMLLLKAFCRVAPPASICPISRSDVAGAPVLLSYLHSNRF